MAMIETPGLDRTALWPPMDINPASGWQTSNTQVIDASGEKIAQSFQILKAGILDGFECWAVTVADNTNGLRLSFQDPIFTTGYEPDETQDQWRVVTGLTSNDWVVTGKMTSDGTDDGTPRTVAVGDRLSIVIEFENFDAADSVLMATTNITNGSSMFTNSNVAWAKVGAPAWTKINDRSLVCVLRYSDGSYVPVPSSRCFATESNSLIQFKQDTSPDEVGLKFRVPYGMRCIGCAFGMDPNTEGVFTLYDTNDNVLGSYTYDDDSGYTAAAFYGAYFWSASVDLVAGTDYRCTYVPSETNAQNNLRRAKLPNLDEAYRSAWPGGAEYNLGTTSRTNAGAWTDDNTILPTCAIIYDAVDIPRGTGKAWRW